MRDRRPRLSTVLLNWYRRGHRELPWRQTSDPYRIWLSEIMLQQTRAQAVIPYYKRFLERFPNVEALADAAEEEVLAVWSGLGYYSRARNMRRAAREILAAGRWPRDYDGLRALAGVGDYTAAAIGSIALGLPLAVVDGNVLRVVARVENDASDIGSAGARQRFRAMAQSWLDPRQPGMFNQAMMELGATICVPRNPLCAACPLGQRCRALAAGTVTQLPVKLRKAQPIHLDAVLLVVRDGARVLLRQRDADARCMAGFWDLPTPQDLPLARRGRRLGHFRHTITHHYYRFEVVTAKPRGGHPPGAALRWFDRSQLAQIPLSTTARKALNLLKSFR